MKVCTDACLFGAVAASVLAEAQNVKGLDIGTGTGLLSLMIAQKNKTAVIDAVEVDEAAAQQAIDNFGASPWKENLAVHSTAIQQFVSPAHSFDFIISNPPFFENDLKSNNSRRNLALHSVVLGLEELLTVIDALLKRDGVFGVLLPYHRSANFEMLAADKGFNLTKKIMVKQTPNHSYFRSILFFCKAMATCNEQKIIIKGADNEYTAAFKELLRDYYLHL